MNEFEESDQMNVPEMTQNPETSQPEKNENHTVRKNFSLCRIIIDSVIVVAIIILFILYFFFPREKVIQPYVYEGKPGSGEIVYINIDTINDKYKLVDILTKDIESEQAKQEAIFANRQKALETKYMQFQQNYQSGILTQVQVQNTQEQLSKEGATLQQEYETVSTNLQTRHIAALKQIADSLVNAAKRINTERNASFIFTYQYGGQLIVADPTKDITNEVLEELNKPYK